MITINGKVKKQGIAIAVAAIVDTQNGINRVSPDLLQEGIQALVKGTSPKDFPEAIIVCDNLIIGASIKLPGIKATAIIAQSDVDSGEFDIDVPCIIGIPNLMQSVDNGDIVIVDGGEKTVFIDPDPQTLVRYQQIEESHISKARFFIGSEHIPAQTQDGETVFVFACVNDLDETVSAIDEGADGLLVDLRGTENSDSSFYKDILFAAAGKPVAFAVDRSPVDIIESAKQFSSPGQVKILFEHAKFYDLMDSIESILEEMMINAQEDPYAPAIVIGVISGHETYTETSCTYYTTIDLRECEPTENQLSMLRDFMKKWTSKNDAQDAVVAIGTHIDVLKEAVNAGARCVAVCPKSISKAKYLIREIGLEDTEV